MKIIKLVFSVFFGLFVSFQSKSQKGDSQIRLFSNRSDYLIDRPQFQTNYAYLTFGTGIGVNLTNKISLITDVEFGGLLTNKVIIEPQVGSMSSALLSGKAFFQWQIFNAKKVSFYANIGGNLQNLENSCSCFSGDRYRMEYSGLAGVQINYQINKKWAFFFSSNAQKPISTTLNDPNYYMSNLETINTKDIMFNNSFGIVFKIEHRKEIKKNLDTDKDGIKDELDKCPNTPAGEFVNNDGCSDSQLDSDGDGITNNKDKCLLTPKGEKVDANGCSDSQKDSDGDGVNDLKDKCSSTIKGEAVNADGCSESQLDTDSDGIFNHVDRCPTIKGDISNFGCPINPMAKLEKQVTEIANEVNFVTNKADLLVASKSKLNELIVLLLENPDLKIIISGHTDDVGTEEFNFTLSEKRAQSVLDYLAEKGISKLRMTSLAYGEQQLKQVGISEDSRFKNRRVEIKIIN